MTKQKRFEPKPICTNCHTVLEPQAEYALFASYCPYCGSEDVDIDTIPLRPLGGGLWEDAKKKKYRDPEAEDGPEEEEEPHFSVVITEEERKCSWFNINTFVGGITICVIVLVVVALIIG